MPEFMADISALESRLYQLLESEKKMKIVESDQATALAEIDRLTQVLRTQVTQMEAMQKALDEQVQRTLEQEARSSAASRQVEELRRQLSIQTAELKTAEAEREICSQQLAEKEEKFHLLRLRHLRHRSH